MGLAFCGRGCGVWGGLHHGRPLPGTDAPAGLATETPTPRIVMATATRIESATATSAAPDPDTGDTRLYPEDMAYLGAFRCRPIPRAWDGSFPARR